MMTLARVCPGSRNIREDINCPNCGKEVGIRTDELKATCRGYGNKVFRVQRASCSDWSIYTRECVEPEAHERLGVGEDLGGANTPLDILKRKHERVLKNVSLLVDNQERSAAIKELVAI
jgi:hypothetical protein